LDPHPPNALRSALADFRDIAKFAHLRSKYYKRFRPNRSLSENGELFDTLTRDGIAIVPNFFDRESTRQMLASVPQLEFFEESPEGDRAYLYPNAQRIPGFGVFFGNTIIDSLVRAYISPQAAPQRQTIGIKTVTGALPTFEMFYHMDTWRHRVKAWCYLDDVGPDQAPMMYLRRSHKRGNWRFLTEADIYCRYRTTPTGFASQESLYVGCFWPHHVDALKKRYGYSDVLCTGPAGTLVVFDARGLHRATPLVSGRRAVLLSYWGDGDCLQVGVPS
jgi:hypothetical protein